MKMFAHKKPPQPDRRHVSPLGRTNAYAYYARRSPEHAVTGRRLFREAVKPETARRAASFWIHRFGMLIIIIAAIVCLVSILGVSADPKVLPIDADQTDFLHDMPTYQQAAQKLFAGSVLNNNKITINTDSIANGLKREFPELSIVTVDLPLIGHRPIVYIAPADTVLVLTANSGRQYSIDTSGRAVAAISASVADALHLVPVKDESDSSIQIGQPALSSDTVEFIRTVAFQLQQKKLEAKTFVLPAGKSELDLYLAGRSYFVKFNLESGTALQQAGTLFAVQHDLGKQGITPGQYIDVRVDGRAYYK